MGSSTTGSTKQVSLCSPLRPPPSRPFQAARLVSRRPAPARFRLDLRHNVSCKGRGDERGGGSSLSTISSNADHEKQRQEP